MMQAPKNIASIDSITPPAVAQVQPQVLIVDDNPANLDVLGQVLESGGYRVLAAPTGERGLRIAISARPDLILLDVMMPDLDGYELCRRLKSTDQTRDIPVIFVSAGNETRSIVKGLQIGAVDYLTKPFEAEEVLMRVATHVKIAALAGSLAQKNQDLQRRGEELAAANESLRAQIRLRERAEEALETAGEQLSAVSEREAAQWGIDAFIGRSATLQRILSEIRRVQNFGSVNVLITGESGTGKELIARAIHFGSPRRDGPFVPVNCVAIPHELAESMLFGHVRGAFTGATGDRRGYFELSHGGTLFLDEIGDMPVSLQAKLLRVLEDGRVTPIGSNHERKVDVRVVAATNADLDSQIDGGGFRSDLYFRLSQFTVELPPLRMRRDDVPLLATHFIALFAREMGLQPPGMDRQFLEQLSRYDFPGNVRELKNVIERALIESGGGMLRAAHLRLGRGTVAAKSVTPAALETDPASNGSFDGLPLNLDQAEVVLIRRALAGTGGNVAEAARRLGINRTRIYRRLGEINPSVDASAD